MTTEMQFIANCRSLLMQIEIALSYSGPKCSTEYPEHGMFEGKTWHLALHLLRVGVFTKARSLTEANLLNREGGCSHRKCNKS